MKNKNYIFLILLFSFNIILGQSLFKEIPLVDEFGDKIGTTLANVSIGTFSNTATTASELMVKSIWEEAPTYTLESLKEYHRSIYEKAGYGEKQISRMLKQTHKSLDAANNTKGTITFYLYEYRDNPANIRTDETGYISIKLANGEKLRSEMGMSSFHTGSPTITAYKERNQGMYGVENMIKYGTYYWEQTDIYNAIINSDEPIDVVISLKTSTYRFKLNPQLSKTEE